MAYERLEHAGGAVTTTLTNTVTSGDSTLSLDAATGWPDGSNGPFWVVVGLDLPTEEKVLVTARSATTLTGVARGQDGTAASAHASGETCAHVYTATEADEANLLVNQTLGTVSAKGDLTPASAAGTLGHLAVGTDGLPLVADSSAATGLKYAALTAAALAANSVGASQIAADAVGTSEIAADAVTASEIATDAVGTAEIASSAVTDVELAADAVTTVKITDANVTTAKIADNAITNAKLADDAVHTAEIQDAAVTPAKVAAGGLGGPIGALVNYGSPIGNAGATLATINIPAQPFAYTLDVAAFWSGQNTDINDVFSFNVKVDGTTRGRCQVHHGGGTNRDMLYSVACTELVDISASTTCAVTVNAIKESGTGALNQSATGRVVAHLYPKKPV